MIPGKYNMVCPQGTTFKKTLTYSIDEIPVNLFGYSARLQVRESYSSPRSVVNIATGSGITLGGSQGTIDLLIPSTVTKSLAPKEYVYDLEITNPSSEDFRLIEGKFIVTPEVTK